MCQNRAGESGTVQLQKARPPTNLPLCSSGQKLQDVGFITFTVSPLSLPMSPSPFDIPLPRTLFPSQFHPFFLPSFASSFSGCQSLSSFSHPCFFRATGHSRLTAPSVCQCTKLTAVGTAVLWLHPCDCQWHLYLCLCCFEVFQALFSGRGERRQGSVSAWITSTSAEQSPQSQRRVKVAWRLSPRWSLLLSGFLTALLFPVRVSCWMIYRTSQRLYTDCNVHCSIWPNMTIASVLFFRLKKEKSLSNI